jgi:signal transduction histidine kinase
LELAKLHSYEISVHPEPFNLSDLVQDVAQKFSLKAEEKGIDIVTNLEETLPFARADIGLIEPVSENLLQNAIHYTPRGGVIRLVLTPGRENISP